MVADEIDKKALKEIFNPIKECEYSSDQLHEMKALGMPKPPGVSWGSWMGPRKENHTHEALIYMAASGANQKQIATDLGYTQSRISIILSKPEIKQKVRAVQAELWGENAEKRFKNILPRAIDVFENVIDDKNATARDRMSAAREVADRALGKPQQSISVEGNLLHDLISRLDQESTRDVTHPELTSEREKDSVDEFVDEFIESNYKVGKRDKDGA